MMNSLQVSEGASIGIFGTGLETVQKQPLLLIPVQGGLCPHAAPSVGAAQENGTLVSARSNSEAIADAIRGDTIKPVLRIGEGGVVERAGGRPKAFYMFFKGSI